jgi:hypothetical protein
MAVLETDRRSSVVETALIVLVAFAFRAVFIAETRYEAPFDLPPPGLDVDLHWQAARMLRADLPVQFEWRMLSAPLHPLLLALGQALFGESILRLRILSAAAGP